METDLPPMITAARKSPSRATRIRCLVILFGMLLVVTLQGCNSLFYHPDAYPYRTLDSIPGAEESTFASRDGTKLHAWFLPVSSKPKGTVVYFHGNAQNLTSHISFVDWLPAEGFQVFAFDYRGYGKSEGCASRQGLHEDSIAALEYVSKRADVDANRLVVLAQSLGGACATAALGETGIKVRGLALDSTFAHYISMGNEVLGGTFLTYPLAWLLLSNSHSPADVIANIAPTPILCFHSPEDPVVPISQGRALHAAAGDPKAFLEVPVRGHPVATTSRAARARLLQFFEACLKD
ncbi:MAG: fermentation-respiration switch protein FrsA (DUF1100 family) [Planctomycetota bacterium]|jgi:fermentation-respiration switch protein FrsA (DUF1100 family)